MIGRRKRRVRVHLIDKDPRIAQPSVEGILVGKLAREYVLALPELLVSPERDAVVLDEARLLAIPRENVAFYEVLR